MRSSLRFRVIISIVRQARDRGKPLVHHHSRPGLARGAEKQVGVAVLVVDLDVVCVDGANPLIAECVRATLGLEARVDAGVGQGGYRGGGGGGVEWGGEGQLEEGGLVLEDLTA